MSCGLIDKDDNQLIMIIIVTLQELERKFSETGAYKNLKKMLSSKNDQIKELRMKLKKAGGADSGDEEEEE